MEWGTIMRGNLGLSTQKGIVINSDSDPATFWITHPNVTITGNVAAGGVGKGFWILQPDTVTGLSKVFQVMTSKSILNSIVHIQ